VPSQRPSEDGRDLEPSASERVGVEPLATKHGCQNKINGSEVGGVKPKVPPTGKSSSEFDVFALSRYAYASRDVRDVRACRAYDVARATDQ